MLGLHNMLVHKIRVKELSERDYLKQCTRRAQNSTATYEQIRIWRRKVLYELFLAEKLQFSHTVYGTLSENVRKRCRTIIKALYILK